MWARIDDEFHSHPKVQAAGNEAIGVYVRALSWTNAYGTEGRIYASNLHAFDAGIPEARRLVEVGLWEECEGGWMIHDYADYQPDPNGSKRRSDAARKAALARWRNADSNADSNAERNADA